MNSILHLLIIKARIQNISLQELANKTGLTKMTVYNIFTGRTNPSITHLEKLAKVLNLNIVVEDLDKPFIVIEESGEESWLISKIENGKKTLIEEIEYETIFLNQLSEYFIKRITPYLLMGKGLRINL